MLVITLPKSRDPTICVAMWGAIQAFVGSKNELNGMISTTHRIYAVSIGQMEMIFKLVIVKETKVTSKQENMGERKTMKIEQSTGQRRRRQCCKPLMPSCPNYLYCTWQPHGVKKVAETLLLLPFNFQAFFWERETDLIYCKEKTLEILSIFYSLCG